jgi:hypothetical protein
MTSTKDAKSETRKLKVSKFRRHKLRPVIKSSRKPIPSSYKMMKDNFKHILKHKKIFFGISFIYFLASIVLVTGVFGTADYSELKRALNELFSGVWGQIGVGFTLFGSLLTGGASSASSESGGVYQMILLVVISIVIIWSLRQTYSKSKITIKDSFYKSMTPLIPFILVIFAIGIQLIPLIAATTIYSTVIAQSIATTVLEKSLWIVLVIALISVSFYLITSSIFALYIVTLPDVTPMQALRTARELIRYRRWTVMRKVLFLPLTLLVLGALIMVPILLFATFVAQWIFIFLTMAGLVIAHGYMYRLYRDLM